MKKIRFVITLLLLVSTTFILISCEASNSSESNFKNPEDAANYAIRTVFGFGDEIEQLMWIMSPTIKNNSASYNKAVEEYGNMMDDLAEKGYQYCNYKLNSHYILAENDSEYWQLGFTSADGIKAVNVYNYTITPSSDLQDILVSVYLVKISSHWFVQSIRID